MAETLREAMDRIFREGLNDLGDQVARLAKDARIEYDTTPLTDRPWPGQFGPEPIVFKMPGWLPVSCCVLTDSTGENHCTHAPPPRPKWHRRLRWRISDRWSSFRLRLGSWIAGRDLNEEDW